MSTGIFFIVSSLFYALLLNIAYFLKPRLKSIENRIYSFLVSSTLVGIVLELLCRITIPIMNTIPVINYVVSRLYLIYLISWMILLSLYIFSISLKTSDKMIDENRKKIKKYTLGFSIIAIILSIIIFILPLYFFNEKNIIYSFGPGVDFVYGFSVICFLVWFIYMGKNFENIRSKKSLPVIIFVFIGAICSVIQRIYPGMLLMTSAEAFVTFLMYFTIENPDMKMIEQLNVAKEQADNANRAKTDFLSNMSHEIRTPLNAIVGFSEILETENIPDSSRELVHDIIISSENLVEIVNGVLDISKIEANKLEIVNTEYSFKKIFDEMVTLAKGRLGDKGLDFEYSCDQSMPEYLYGDAVRVKQIGINLLTNAIKYTKEGSIKFIVSSVVYKDMCRLIFSVEDTGIGIRKENIDKLFTKFERLGVEKNTTVEGTGLGLAITKKLVELMNGKISVQSVFGSGSKFTIVLDQKIVTSHKEEKPVNLEPIKSNTVGKRVLVVDDNELNIKVVSRLLAKYNIEVDSSTSGFICLDKIKENEKYNLILLDDMMPKMSGTETLTKLKEIENFNIPVVVLTANAISGMREKYISSGFNDYLSKPIEKLELERIIQKYLS